MVALLKSQRTTFTPRKNTSLTLHKPSASAGTTALRIMYLVQDAQTDGVGAYAADLACASRAAGNDVFWVSPKGVMTPHLPINGIRVMTIENGRLSYFSEQLVMRRLITQVRNEGMQMIHVHGGNMARLGAHVAGANNIPYVVSAYQNLKQHPEPQQRALRAAQHLFTANHTIAENAIAMDPALESRCSVTGLAIDLDRFSTRAMKPMMLAHFCRDMNIADDTSVVLFPVNRPDSKVLKLYLNTIKNVDAPWPVITLFTLPPDADKAFERMLIERLDNAHYLDHALVMPARGDSRLYYQLADIVINDRQDEGFDRTITQAQAFGKPVVAALSHTVENQIKHGKTGWIFMPGSPQSLSAALTRTLNLDTGARREYANTCQKMLKRDYDIHSSWKATSHVYQQVLATDKTLSETSTVN